MTEDALARQRFEAEAQARVSRNAMCQAEVQKRRDAHEHVVEQAQREADEHNQQVERFEAAFRAADLNAIATYFATVLESSPYPEGFPLATNAEYQAESKQLIVAYDLPEYDEIIPAVKSVRYVKTTDSFTKSARPEVSGVRCTPTPLPKLRCAHYTKFLRLTRMGS